MNPDGIQQPLVPTEPPAPQVPEVPPAISATPTTPVAPIETNAFVPENPKKSSPLLIIAIILAVVALLAVVAYFFGAKYFAPQLTSTPTPVAVLTPSPTTDPTANWKTFTDVKNGIDFKYPESWTAKAVPGWTLSVFLDDHPFEIPTASELITPISLGFNEVMNTETNQKYFDEKLISEKQKSQEAGFTKESLKVTQIKVGGKDAIQISGIMGPGPLEGQFAKTTLIQMDGKILSIGYSLLNNKDYSGIYDQILSTFKFIEATPAASPTASPTASPSSSPSATP